LGIKVIKEGAGVGAKTGDTISVLYTGKLTNGTVFDASSLHGNQPFSFTLGGRVIQGWNEGLIGAKAGEELELTIPPQLGYGATPPQGSTIPPNATLIFDITVESIN
jgi:FKBP-type peptidyl-prolyl cis-trans isomerase